METIFVSFAIITSICLAVWGYRHMGCIGAIILFVGSVFLLSVAESMCIRLAELREQRLAEKARQAEIRKTHEAEQMRAVEIERRKEEKNDKVRAFALKEAPKVWEVYQSLNSEIDVQNEKIEELRKSLESFGRSPEQDTDFVRICALRDDMTRSRDALRTKLEDAYIAAKKYEAAPSRKDYQELHKKALEDGILEADAASARFKEMRRNK